VVTATPFGWRSLADELRDFAIAEFGVVPSSALDTAIEVQRVLMPDWGRTFPVDIPLEHDYVAYYMDATRSLFETGIPGRPPQCLERYGPGTLTVIGDPEGYCRIGLFRQWLRDESFMSSFYTAEHRELDSVLVRNGIPEVAGVDYYRGAKLGHLGGAGRGASRHWEAPAEMLQD
jgi:hypothetical protein